MKTLLHICCAPCANQPIEVLRTDGIEVTGFWYNPNIHPFTEYRARRNCLRDYAATIELPIIERNTVVPASRVKTVQTVADNQMKRHPTRLPSARHSSSSALVWWISSTTSVSDG